MIQELVFTGYLVMQYYQKNLKQFIQKFHIFAKIRFVVISGDFHLMLKFNKFCFHEDILCN